MNKIGRWKLFNLVPLQNEIYVKHTKGKVNAKKKLMIHTIQKAVIQEKGWSEINT